VSSVHEVLHAVDGPPSAPAAHAKPPGHVVVAPVAQPPALLHVAAAVIWPSEQLGGPHSVMAPG
jgi:hypothetical protein